MSGIRWWNIGAGIFILAVFTVAFLPLLGKGWLDGIQGNLYAEFWGLTISFLVAWAAFEHFRAERWTRERSGAFLTILREMEDANQVLCRAALESPATARAVLTSDIRENLLRVASYIHTQVVFYNRFLKFKELANLEELYTSMAGLSQLKENQPDEDFMYQFTLHSWHLQNTLKHNSKDQEDIDLSRKLAAVHVAWTGRYLRVGEEESEAK